MTHTPNPFFFFFFNDTATTEIYTLSLHDALPISMVLTNVGNSRINSCQNFTFDFYYDFEALQDKYPDVKFISQDRKSTRLNSSHDQISYAVFCLKKKNIADTHHYLATILT